MKNPWEAPRDPGRVERLAHSISILIPAFNEAGRIADTIAAVRRSEPMSRAEIIVVDDGSVDETASIAEVSGADIVYRQRNSGKGAALEAAVRLSCGDILLLLDADLGATAAEGWKLLAPILAGEADMAIATFPVRPRRGGGMGLVVGLAAWGIRTLTGRSMAAPLSGQRALRRNLLEACGGFARGWAAEITLTVRALRLGYRVCEVPTEMNHRVTGRSLPDVLHRAAQFRAVCGALVSLFAERLWIKARRTKTNQPHG